MKTKVSINVVFTLSSHAMLVEKALGSYIFKFWWIFSDSSEWRYSKMSDKMSELMPITGREFGYGGDKHQDGKKLKVYIP